MHLKHLLTTCLILTLPFIPFLSAIGQGNGTGGSDADESEVYLSFRHRSAVNALIIAYYKDEQFYLPVNELFNTLQIDVNNQLDGGGVVLTGIFLDTGERYTINFSRQFAEFGGKRIELDNSDFLLKEIDYFLSPEIFDRLFELDFSVNFNALSLNLEAPYTLPIVARYLREQERERARTTRFQFEDYDLRYDRNREMLNGGFVDYTVSTDITETNNIFSAATDIGVEVAGGDLQGSLFGVFSQDYNSLTTNNLRWRYVDRHGQWFRQASVGQISSTGLTNQQILGVRVSNNPVRPRVLFDEFVINGNTIPQSEVELYLNNALVEYQKADELGNYRFLVPMTYGNSRLNLRIYGPTGQVEEISQRIQIPFNFLPSGETNYNVNVGQLEDPFFSSSDNLFTVQSDIGRGFTNWLTGKAGIEYFEGTNSNRPTIYGSLSARVASQYLFNIDVAPDAYYKFSTSVVYPSSASWGFDLTHYNTDNRLYNFANSNQELSGNFFLPFEIGAIPFYIRMDGFRQFRDFSDLTRYRLNLNSRIERLSLSLGFLDNQVGTPRFETTSSARLTGSLTYNLPHRAGVPKYLRGAFIRWQANYSPALSQLEDLELILSQNIFREGRLQLSFRRNYIGEFNSIGLNFAVDFNKVRTTSTFRSVRDNNSFTNTVRGSIGYDSRHGDFLATSRQQVGRSGAAVRLYVDSNNSGSYDKGDDIIPSRAVRLRRSSGSISDNSGVTYLTQLQAYDRYNLEINKSAIQNPLLVPEFDNFSFITDPNSYKPIDIPFYMSGVISGTVRQAVRDTTRAVAGLKVILEDVKSGEQNELRTFSDGSFYSYEVPPGNYKVYVDSTQLEILKVTSRPKSMEIEVNAVAEGDFIEGLNFRLISRTADTTQAQDSVPADRPSETETLKSSRFQVQIASFKFFSNATRAVKEAEKQFDQPFRIKFNPHRKLFGVRTEPIEGIQKAIEVLFSIQNSQFNLPALVVLDSDKQVVSNKDHTYSVQLATYESNSEAKEFINSFHGSIRRSDLTLEYDTAEKQYKVLTRAYETKQEAENKLKEIRNSVSYNNAIVITNANVIIEGDEFEYQIRVEGVKAESGKSYLDQLPDGMADLSDIKIRSVSPGDVILLEQIREWDRVIDLKRRLSELSDMGKPVIILIEKN